MLETLLDKIPVLEQRHCPSKYVRVMLANIFNTLLHLDEFVNGHTEWDYEAEEDDYFVDLLMMLSNIMKLTNIAPTSSNRDAFTRTIHKQLKYLKIDDFYIATNDQLPTCHNEHQDENGVETKWESTGYEYLVNDDRIHWFLKFFEQFILTALNNTHFRRNHITNSDTDQTPDIVKVYQIDYMVMFHANLIESLRIISRRPPEPSYPMFDPYDLSPIDGYFNVELDQMRRYGLIISDDDESIDVETIDPSINARPLENIPKIPEISKECCVCLESDQLLQLACYHICCYACYGKIGDKCPSCRETIVSNLTKRL